MKIKEFLAMFEGRNPESELSGVVLPTAQFLTVTGVANRGEFATLLDDEGDGDVTDTEVDQPPDTLPTGFELPSCETVRDLEPGQKWDDTYIILDDEGKEAHHG